MNPTETIHDKIKKYDELRRNPMSDSRTVDELRKSFDVADLKSLSNEEKRILFAD